MKNYIYGLGIFAFALSMSGVPALAFAEGNIGTTGVTARNGEELQRQQEVSREEGKQNAEVTREQSKNRLENASTSTRPSIKGGDDEQEINLELEDDNEIASSNEDLNQKIEVRKHQLEQEVASSSPEHQAVVANANEVRLAVHALLASKDLVGGIGQQVSDIAKEVDHSVASTTNAEAKIHSRGFFSKLLFGGDTTSAEVIAQEAAKNQTRIDSLTTLLADATITPEVKATLDAQITALKAAQTRLQALADKEKSAWGLFSWRF